MEEEELRALGKEAHRRGDKATAMKIAQKLIAMKSAPAEPALADAPSDLAKSAEISAIMPASSTLDTLERGSRQFDRTFKEGALTSEEGGIFDKPNFKDPVQTATYMGQQALNLGGALVGKAVTSVVGDDTRKGWSKTMTEKMNELKAERSKPVQKQYDNLMDAANNSDSIVDFVKKAPSPLEEPMGYLHAFVEQVGNTAASMVATRGAAALKAARVRSKMTKLGSTADEIRKEAMKSATATGVAVGSATEYHMVASQVGQQIDQQLMAMPQEKWDANEDYQKLREHTTDEEAKQIISDRLARQYGRIAGLGSSIINMPFAGMLAKMGAGAGGVKKWAAGTATEMASEAGQEFWEGLNQNLAAQKVDPDTDILKGLGGQAALGGIMGGGMGALASVSPRSANEKILAKAGIDDYESAVKDRAKLEKRMIEPKSFNKMSPQEKIEAHRKLEDAQMKESEAFLGVAKGYRQILTRDKADPDQFDSLDVLEQIHRGNIDHITERRSALAEAATEASRRDALEKQVDDLRDARNEGLASIDDEKRWLTSLQHLASGNVLEQPHADELLSKKWIRYPDVKKTHAVLTPSGRRAIRGLELSIKNHEGMDVQHEAALESISETRQPVDEAPKERRSEEGTSRRAKLEELKTMDPEAFHREIFVDKKSGILNKRAYVEAQKTPSPHTAMIDADSLAWVNDNMSHPKGDEMLERIGRALGSEFGEDAYHISGDEFIVRGDDAAKLEEGMQRVKQRLRRMRVQNEKHVVSPTVTWGIGANQEEADAKMNEAKARRQKEGKRAERKMPPIGIKTRTRIEPTVNQTEGVPPDPASRNSVDSDDEEMNQRVTDITDTAMTASVFGERMRGMAIKMRRLYKAAVGEARALETNPVAPRFNTIRLRQLEQAWDALQLDAVEAFEGWRREVTPDQDLDAALVAKARFMYHNVSPAIRQEMADKARYFYGPLLAEPFLSAQDAFVIEYTGLLAYRAWDETMGARANKLPNPMTTIGEGRFTHGLIALSDMAERVRQLVQDSGDAHAEGSGDAFLSEFLLNDLRKEATNWNRLLQIKPDEAKWSSIALQPEGAVRPLTAADILLYRVERYITRDYQGGGPHPFVMNQKELDAYKENANKYASFYPVMHANTDSTMTPGFYDRLAKGRYVEVFVGGKTVTGRVVNSSEKSVIVQWDGPQAWDPDEGQVSNTARYSKDTGLQVSQRVSKDGIPLERQFLRWPGQSRLGRIFVQGEWKTAKNLYDDALKVEKEVDRRLPRHIQSWRNNQRKHSADPHEMKTAVQIANALAFGINLPNGFIRVFADGTAIPPPRQTFLANRPDLKMSGWWDSDGGVNLMLSDIKRSVESGHYPSFEHGVAETIAHELFGHYGIRGLIGNDESLKNIMQAVVAAFPEEARYFTERLGYAPDVAGEEIVASLAQKILIDNIKLTSHQESIWKRFMFWLREAMAKRGWARYMKGPLAFNDEQLGWMIARAQEALQSSEQANYKNGKGEPNSPSREMRDSSMFKSALLTDLDRHRPTSKAERKSGAPESLPVIPEEATAGGYLNAFRALIKDKSSAVKQLDLDTAGLESWLENLRNADVLAYAPELRHQILGEAMSPIADEAAEKLWDHHTEYGDLLRVMDELDEWATKPLHKKARIPKEMIRAYLQDSVPEVMVHPAAGYTAGIDPFIGKDEKGEWLPAPIDKSGDPAGGGWWHTALSGRGIRNYLLAQANPRTRVAYEEPHWTDAPRSRGQNVYLHMRVSEGEDAGTPVDAPNPAKQGKVYHIGEVQSTWNQNYGRYMQGITDKRNTLTVASDMARLIGQGGMQGFFDHFSNELATLLDQAHERATEQYLKGEVNKSYVRKYQMTPLSNAMAIAEEKMGQAHDQIRIFQEEGVGPNDSRYSALQKWRTLHEAYRTLHLVLDWYEHDFGSYNPSEKMSEWSRTITATELMSNLGSKFVDNMPNDVVAFLAADDNTFKEFVGTALDFNGGMYFEDREALVQKLMSERKIGEGLRVVIPSWVLPWTKEIQETAPVGPDANAFEYIWTTLGLRWHAQQIAKDNPTKNGDIPVGPLTDIAISRNSEGDYMIDIPYGSYGHDQSNSEIAEGYEKVMRQTLADVGRATAEQRAQVRYDRERASLAAMRSSTETSDKRIRDAVAQHSVELSGARHYWSASPKDIDKDSIVHAEYPLVALRELSHLNASVRSTLEIMERGGFPSLERFSKDHLISVVLQYVYSPPFDDTAYWSEMKDAVGHPLDKTHPSYVEAINKGVSVSDALEELYAERRMWVSDQHRVGASESKVFRDARQFLASEWFNIEGGARTYFVPRSWHPNGDVNKQYEVYTSSWQFEPDNTPGAVVGYDSAAGYSIRTLGGQVEVENHELPYNDGSMDRINEAVQRHLSGLWEANEEMPPKHVVAEVFGEMGAPEAKPARALSRTPERLDWDAISKAIADNAQFIPLAGADFKQMYKRVREAATRSAMLGGHSRDATSESVFSNDDVWKTHALKFALMDAIRHGYSKIQWQPGEANTSRGGVSPDKMHQLGRMKFKRATIDGKEIYIARVYDQDVWITPERLDAVFGIDAAEFMKKASKSEGGMKDRVYVVAKAGSRWVVIDKTGDSVSRRELGHVVHSAESASDAYDWAAKSVEQQSEEYRSDWMVVTREDLGGPINVVLASDKSKEGFLPLSDFISDTAARVIQGGRIAYDRSLVKTWNKFLKNFDVQVTDGAAKVSQEAADIAIRSEGGRRVYNISPYFAEKYPNPRVAPIDGENGYALLSDSGPIKNTVYQYESDAHADLDAEMASWGPDVREENNSAIKTHEIVINDKLREFFEKGNIPLFHMVPGQGGSAEERLMKKVGAKKEPRPLMDTVKEIKETFVDQTHQRVFDRFHGIQKAYKDAMLWDDLADEKNAYFAARLGTSLDSHVKSALEYGVPVWKNGVFSAEGKGLLEILSPVASNMQMWGAYMAARRASRLRGEGRENLLEADEIAAGLALGAKYPIFEQVANEYAEYNRKLLDFAQESGIINAETRPLWEHADYVPFYRISDDRMMGGMGRNVGLANQKNPIKTLTGGQDRLGDIATNIMVNMVNLIDGSVKNRAALMAIDGLSGTGKIRLSDDQNPVSYHPPLPIEEAQMVGPDMVDGTDIGPKLKIIKDRFRITNLQLANAIPGRTEGQINGLMSGSRAKISVNEINQILEAIESLAPANSVVPRAKVAIDNVMARIGMAREQKLVPASEIKRALQQAGVSPKLINSIPADAFEGLRKMWAVVPPTAKGTVSVMRDGKIEYYNTPDQLLFDALTSINMPRFGWFVAALRSPKRLLTGTITLDPGFMIANFLRDSVSSWVIARDWQVPLVNSAKGMVDALSESKDMRDMMSAGAAFENGLLNYGDPEHVHRMVRRAMRRKGFRASLLDSPKKLYEAYRAIGSASENASRIAVYRAAKKAGKSDVRAAYEAKDLMDFSMGGSAPAIQFLIQTVPFLNARMQGLYRLGRGAGIRGEGSLGAFALRGMLVAMAGLALWWQYKDDDRYKKLEEWDKDTNFHFWTGDQHWRLPKPFEVGAIFNTLIERAAEYFRSDAGDAGALAWDRFAFMMTQTFAFNPIPQAFAPIVETAANYNFFTGRSIANQYETEAKLPQDQYRYYTSPTMIELAQHIPASVQFKAQRLSSPLFMQNLFGGYFGTLGRYVLMGSDAIVRDGFGYPDIPSLGPVDYPVLGRFSRGTDEPRRTKYEEQFYDLLAKVKQADGSFKYYEKQGPKERVLENLEKFGQYTRIAEDVLDAEKAVSEINAAMRFVYSSTTLSPDAKHVKLNELQEKKNALLEKAAQLRPNAVESRDTQSSVQKKLQSGSAPEKVADDIREVAPMTAELIMDVVNMSQANGLALRQ